MPDKVEKLILQRNVHAAPVIADNSAYAAIKAYIEDTTGTIVLSDENRKILNRWKNIHHLRLEGFTNEQVISGIMKLHDVCEKTVRRDLKNYTKIFRYDFDPDYEMYLTMLQVEMQYKKACDAGDQKMIDKLLDKKIKLNEYFKGDGSLPAPELFTQINIVVTANPEDVGLERVPYTQEQLMKMFLDKKKKIQLKEEQAEAIPFEDGKQR